MKDKKTVVGLLLVCIIGIVGASIAYFSSTDTFQNIFGTKSYKMEVVETFESPDDWTPGTTTPKTVVATNKGDVDAAVRVSFVEEWKDSDGVTLPVDDGNGHSAAIIDFANDSIRKWYKSVENNKTYYYYRTKIAKNESTSTLIDSVTFNPALEIDSDHNCVTDNDTHKQTCTTETSGYAGGSYKLTIKVETIQYDQYKSGWNTNVDIANGPLMPLNIVSGDLDTTGSEVCIESECFYVVGAEDSTHIKLLSKYNLNVGVNPNTNVWEKIQDKSILGYAFVNGVTTYGNVSYTATSYWTDGYNLKPQYGDSYPVYVYDNNADISVYVNQYVDYLNTILNNVQGRLISADELVTLGCSLNDGDCSNAPDWVYKTSYWTGTASSGYYMKVVGALGQFNTGSWGSENPMFRNSSLGVRPLIIVEKQ